MYFSVVLKRLDFLKEIKGAGLGTLYDGKCSDFNEMKCVVWLSGVATKALETHCSLTSDECIPRLKT